MRPGSMHPHETYCNNTTFREKKVLQRIILCWRSALSRLNARQSCAQVMYLVQVTCSTGTLHQWLAAQLVAIPRINIHLLILTLIHGVELHQTFELCVSGSDLWYAGISQRMNVSGSISAHYIWEWYFGQTFHREPGGAPVGEGADWNLVWNFRN